MKNIKTEKALSGIEWAVSQTIGIPRQPDEFTCYEFMEAAGGLTRGAAESKLRRLVNDGGLTKRKANVDGSICSLYRRA